jgi:hypothetical protein
MENNEQPISDDESRFLQLLAMFQLAAMQQMGKRSNPLTNEIERDLQQAKASIDVLEMLERKTKGNLSEIEKDFIEKILFELRMNYVDEVDRAGKEEKEATKGEDNATGESSDEEKIGGETGGKTETNSGEDPPDEPESG